MRRLGPGEFVTPKELAPLLKTTEWDIREFVRESGIDGGQRRAGEARHHHRHRYDATVANIICEKFGSPLLFLLPS